MRYSRQFLFAVLGFGLSSVVWAAGPVSSDLPGTSQNSPPLMIPGGVMASASASGFASGNGNGAGQTMSKAQAQVQIGSMPQFSGSPGNPFNGNLPANLIQLNPNQLINPAVSNPAAGNQVGGNPVGVTRRAVSTAANSEDKITTGADHDYSTVIKVKPNGQITMIVVTLSNMEIRRAQAANVDELRKKDKLAYTEYLKYTEAE